MVSLSEGERRILKESLILPMVMTVFARDKQIMERSIKLNRPYIMPIDRAMDQVNRDMVTARKFLRSRGIKVYEEDRSDKGVTVKYKCRGYHHTDSYLWDYLKIEVESRMSRYLHNWSNEQSGRTV
jgi:hypothetical protein